ncbi:MAG: hypothetical protein R2761_31325 [Acidimicrobiales bacterium]
MQPLYHGFALFVLAVLTFYALLWLAAIVTAQRAERADRSL